MSLETWRETSWSSLTILTVSGDYLAAVARVGAGVPGWVLGSCHVLTTLASRQLLPLHATLQTSGFNELEL